MFAACFMWGSAHIAATIARFVGVEVVEAFLSASRQRTVVTVVRIKTIVHMAVEAGMPMEPGSGPNKHPADKPVGAIVAVGRAIVGGIVKVTVRANGSH